MSTLSWRALLSEAWRDCLSGTARVGILTVLATALVGGIICADAFSLRSVSVEAASFRVHLGSVRVLQAQGSIDGATCDALSRIPGVRAGAVRSVESGLSPLALPASSLPLYEVTPGTVSLLGTTTADPTGILLPEQVAEDLGTTQGTLLPLAHGQAEVAGTYPWDENDGRRPGCLGALNPRWKRRPERPGPGHEPYARDDFRRGGATATETDLVGVDRSKHNRCCPRGRCHMVASPRDRLGSARWAPHVGCDGPPTVRGCGMGGRRMRPHLRHMPHDPERSGARGSLRSHPLGRNRGCLCRVVDAHRCRDCRHDDPRASAVHVL